MPLIPNYPKDLLDKHHHWHNSAAHPGSGPDRQHPMGTPGAGLEFLEFHRDFVAEFHAWYATQPGADPTKVAPWSEVPPELKTADAGWDAQWQQDERRLETLDPPFASDDDLGTFIETGIHNGFLHSAAAFVYKEPVLSTHHSPESTHFYGIHGLVNRWWEQWKDTTVPQA